MPDKNLKFLVVDDFSLMRRIVRRLLNELGYVNVDEADSMADTLSKLKNEDFGFVILDWESSEIDGQEMLKSIRSDSKLRHLPVLIFASPAKRADIHAAAEAWHCGWLVKPFAVCSLGKHLSLTSLNTRIALQVGYI